MEGLPRVPFIIRWPDRIPPGRVSNEIVHEADTFSTFAKIAGSAIPQDRPIDGVAQSDFFFGKPKSNREGFPVFVADRMEAVTAPTVLSAALGQCGGDCPVGRQKTWLDKC
jgi:arylsulfatase